MTAMNEQQANNNTIDEQYEMNAGSATFLVRGPEIAMNSPFWDWLAARGYSRWSRSRGFFSGVNWVWINLKSKKYVLGMPGVRRAEEIGDHAITVEEFKTILAIFDKYEGKSPLDMG